ncbi:dienelactone hydrolase family protein [Iamia majanohamensis]|uniref:Dienelactone hydrolase family protein n=1 Tax=Iamia majanohamensis TaxID=467976 RepID=A0AAF0BVS2_9ACTN|nr:dienelactone hydrolase family protein [Iamia majanohamensis]WCO67060.1 dienelactone hydrolase family protein [Iamia majanohamensis]
MTDPVEPTTTLSVARDGDGAMDMPVWLPDGGSGPALVLVQEIFGVGEWIRAVATELAVEGYVVGAPDLYWRLEPGFVASGDEEGMQAAFALAGRLDLPAAVGDVVAALDALDGHEAVVGYPGVLGYCLGGTLAWMAAAAGNPAVCVSYYGSGVPDALDELEAVHCPTLLHFGGDDPYIAREGVDRVAGAVEGQERIEVHVHEGAGHAFENDRAPQFHDPDAATRSRRLTLDFLGRHHTGG